MNDLSKNEMNSKTSKQKRLKHISKVLGSTGKIAKTKTSNITENNITNKILDLCPHFNAEDETRVFRLVQSSLGFRFAMHFLFRVRSAIHLVKSKLKNTFFIRNVVGIRRKKIFQREAKRWAERAD